MRDAFASAAHFAVRVCLLLCIALLGWVAADWRASNMNGWWGALVAAAGLAVTVAAMWETL